MSDDRYRHSGLVGLLKFVLGVPFAVGDRPRSAAAWLLTLPLALVYELFAVPLVVGSVLAVLVLTSPMIVIATLLRARGGGPSTRG